MVVFTRTFLLAALTVCLVSIGSGSAAAQSLTIDGRASTTAPSGLDYATAVMGDPWDFEQQSDYAYVWSDDNTPGSLLSTFQSVPTLANGLLTGTVRNPGNPGQFHAPFLSMIYPGFGSAALNNVGKTGTVFPIDAGQFITLSFRMRRNRATPAGEVLSVQWSDLAGTAGGRILTFRGVAPGTAAQPANQTPDAQQATANQFHIYKVELDRGGQTYGRSWGDVLGGLRFSVVGSNTMVGTAIDVDWVRLTKRGSTVKRLAWSGLGGGVTLTASNAQTGDVIQIYPNSPIGAPYTFPDNSNFDWDFGYLPGGTWTITARGAAQTRTATLTIDPAPVVTLLDPDASGGRDFATTMFADSWDMTNIDDIGRYGRLLQIPAGAFTDRGLEATTRGGDYQSGNPPDPLVQFMDDWNEPEGTEFPINADVFHRLTFTLQYDHPELVVSQALTERWGGVMRIIWGRRRGLPETTVQDIVPIDGIPQTFSVDLHTLRDASGLEGDPSQWTLWNGLMHTLRLRVTESEEPRSFRLSNVKLAADDEPNGNGFFLARWSTYDATFSRQIAGVPNGNDATIALYWDTDKNPATKTLIAQGIPANATMFGCDVTSLAPGQYYIYMVVSDGAGNLYGRYSSGPVRVAGGYPADFRTDSNGNGLPNWWEAKYGAATPTADADGDGVSNFNEYLLGTHPNLSNTWTLSEGSTGFFDERIALSNPDSSPAEVTVTYLRPGGEPLITRDYSLLPFGRVTIDVDKVQGLGAADVSAVITTKSGGVVAERTMFWGNGYYGGHTGKAVDKPGTSWYLAEGASNSLFATFILLANANPSPVDATVTFLRQDASPVTKTYRLGPNSRTTVDAQAVPELAGFSFATRVQTANQPITVERAMYFQGANVWEGGHEAAAVAEPKTSWYVAEGQASGLFSMFLLIANPNPHPTVARVRYLKPGGVVVTRNYNLNAQQRFTIPVNADPALNNSDISAEVIGDHPIVVERAMYWPGGRWIEAHASSGVTSTGIVWALAEGEVGGSRHFESYILFANPSSVAADVQMTFLRKNGAAPISARFTIPANSRVTRAAGEFVGPNGLQSGEQFGVLVQSFNGVPIVIERAMYWDGGGQFWGGGTNETGVRLR